MPMITEFYDVILVDFSGILPFKLEKTDILTRQEQLSQENLERFLADLEKNLDENFVYIGSDLLETKLFHRVILKDGLVELLIGTPITLLAHFKELRQAKKFNDSLQKTLAKILPPKLMPFVAESIEIKKVKKGLRVSEKGFKKLGMVV